MYNFASNDDLPRSSVSYDAGADVSISYTILQSSRIQWVEINIYHEVEVFLLLTFFIPIYPSKIFFLQYHNKLDFTYDFRLLGIKE